MRRARCLSKTSDSESRLDGIQLLRSGFSRIVRQADSSGVGPDVWFATPRSVAGADLDRADASRVPVEEPVRAASSFSPCNWRWASNAGVPPNPADPR